MYHNSICKAVYNRSASREYKTKIDNYEARGLFPEIEKTVSPETSKKIYTPGTKIFKYRGIVFEMPFLRYLSATFSK